MARESTLEGRWKALADRVGGVIALRQLMKVPAATFYRVARGQIVASPEIISRTNEIAKLNGVKSPFDSKTLSTASDIDILRLVGSSLSRGLAPSKKALSHLLAVYPEDTLIRLADRDDVGEDVHRAVAYLLGV